MQNYFFRGLRSKKSVKGNHPFKFHSMRAVIHFFRNWCANLLMLSIRKWEKVKKSFKTRVRKGAIGWVTPAINKWQSGLQSRWSVGWLFIDQSDQVGRIIYLIWNLENYTRSPIFWTNFFPENKLWIDYFYQKWVWQILTNPSGRPVIDKTQPLIGFFVSNQGLLRSKQTHSNFVEVYSVYPNVFVSVGT
jgi:hypothetical protein